MKSRALAILALCVFLLYGMHRTGITPFNVGSGVIGDQRDPLHIMTLVGWTFRALANPQLSYWNAPYFFPLQNTLSYSETFVLPSILVSPLVSLAQGLTVPYNVLFLANYVLSALAAYLLVFYLTRSWWAALFAGIQFGFSTFMISHYAQIPYTCAIFIPLTLLFLLRFARYARLADCILFAVSLLAQILSCLTYGIFLAITVAISTLVLALLSHHARSAKRMIPLGIAGMCVAFLAFLYAQPYLERASQLGGPRSPLEASYFSACLRDYGLGIQGNPIYGDTLQPNNPSKTAGAWLFPGISTLLFAVFGVLTGGVRVKWSNLSFFSIALGSLTFSIGFIRMCLGHPEGVWICGASFIALAYMALRSRTIAKGSSSAYSYEHSLFVALTPIFFVLTFGPIIHLHTVTVAWSPYQLFFEYVPGFAGVRNPSRIYIIFSVALATLAGFGVGKFLSRFRSASLKATLGLAFLCLGALEHYSPPFSLSRLRILDEHEQLDEWLRNASHPSPILELPREPVDMDTMYRALWNHGQPTVGGYSSYLPQFTGWFMEQMQHFPSDASVRLVRQLGVRFVVLHPYRWNGALGDSAYWQTNEILTSHNLHFIRAFEKPQTLVFEVADPTPGRMFKLADYAKNTRLIFPDTVTAESRTHSALDFAIQEAEGRLSRYPEENSSVIARWMSRTSNRLVLQSNVRLEAKFLLTPRDAKVELFIPTPTEPGEFLLELLDPKSGASLLTKSVRVLPP